MDVQEGEKEENQDADMDSDEDSSPPGSHRTSEPAACLGKICKCSRVLHLIWSNDIIMKKGNVVFFRP